jgi:RNA polymerase sigma factor (sigma-70 family)
VNDGTDSELLRAYAECRSEAAFAELVRRHLDLVYTAALRMVCDSHLAEDVTQGVFVAFAKNAAQLTNRRVLSGWLHRTAQNIAAQTVRTIERRRAREQEAVAMNELLSTEAETVWERIAPHLDEALGELSEDDQDALLLRYFERKSAREMAQTLGTSEDAAQKRVSRAVERLREFFAKRDLTVGASGLVVVITANAVHAAPAGLAVTIATAAALAGTAIATTSTVTATKAIVMTTLQKTLITAALAAAVGAGIYEARQASTLETQVQKLQKQQAPLAEQIQQLTKARDDATRQLAALRDDNERLSRNTAELLKLRSEVASLRNESRQLAQRKTGDANDPTAIAAQTWLSRVKLLKQRFDQWPRKKTPELQLLNEQDWLNEAAKRDLDSDTACREAMGKLRWTAKQKFATAVNEALEQFAKSNNEQLPSDPTQLIPFLKPPLDSILEGYEIAKPGSVHPPQPNAPESVRAETWALVEKGNFTPEGIPVQDGSNLSDPDYDMYMVIYRGSHYGYGMNRLGGKK